MPDVFFKNSYRDQKLWKNCAQQNCEHSSSEQGDMGAIFTHEDNGGQVETIKEDNQEGDT